MKAIKAYTIPCLLVVAFFAQLFSAGMLNQFCMGLFSGLMVLSGIGAVVDRFYLDRNERAGAYIRVANAVYRNGSTYWKYKDFDDDNGFTTTFAPAFYVTFLIASTIALGWYLALGIVVLTTVANVYVAMMRDKKARSLILYKKKWDMQTEAEHEMTIHRAEENLRHEEEINRIILESGGEAPELPPEPNAMTANGPVYDPGPPTDSEDLATYNQRIIRPDDDPDNVWPIGRDDPPA